MAKYMVLIIGLFVIQGSLSGESSSPSTKTEIKLSAEDSASTVISIVNNKNVR